MKAGRLSLLLLGLAGIGLLILGRSSVPVTPAIALSPTPESRLEYKAYEQPQAIVHTVTIPPGGRFSIVPAIAPTAATVEEFARTHRAIAVLNAGFFDPQNQQTTSFVTIAGRLIADPRQNDRLMQNPKLASYLDQILDRSELRRYQCGSAMRYDITSHSQPVPADCQLRDAIAAGPQLLPQNTSHLEGFVAVANGETIRDALGSTQPNARSAIGLKRDGSLVWVMVAQKPKKPTQSGFSLPEVTEFLKTLGVEKALNLDGGSSASLYFQGTAYYGKLDNTAKPVQRSVKSVLLTQSPQGF